MNKNFLLLCLNLGLVFALAGCGATAQALTLDPTPGFPNAFTVEPASPDSGQLPADAHIIVATLTPEIPALAAAALDAGQSMRVLWRVSMYMSGIDAVGDTTWAESMLFKPLGMSDNQITFDMKTCQNVTFLTSEAWLGDYLRTRWQADLVSLGLQDARVQVVTTNCDLPGFSEYVRLPDRRLLIQIEGVFFFLEPTVNY